MWESIKSEAMGKLTFLRFQAQTEIAITQKVITIILQDSGFE